MLAPFALGQSKVDSVREPSPTDLANLPSYLSRYAAAFGDRLTKRGSERGSFVAQLQLPDGSRQPVQWLWEYPGKLRLQRPGSARPVLFQPSQPLEKATSTVDETITEVLSADTADFFFAAVATGNIPRWLGNDFRVTDRTGFGSLVDIFQMGAFVNSRTQPGRTVKHFAFDGRTGLLARVHYLRPNGVNATTEYTGYESFGRSTAPGTAAIPVPRTITHRQDKAVILEFTLQSAQFGPSVADNQFSGAQV